jgi:transcriptional regulator with XRE-family HTH domain
MSIRPRQPVIGRPKGALSFDAATAQAFGLVVRTTRLKAEIAQEELALMSGLDRSHLSKIERGLSQPTLFAVFKIADALGFKAATLVGMTQRAMADGNASQ